MNHDQKPMLNGVLNASHSLIVSQAEKVDDSVFLYFLIRDQKIVYVGQSGCVRARIESHKRDKDFDSYTLMSCSPRLGANDLEAHYILEFDPEYNLNLPPNNLYYSFEPKFNMKGLSINIAKDVVAQDRIVPIYKSRWGCIYCLPQLLEAMYRIHYARKPASAMPKILRQKFGGAR